MPKGRGQANTLSTQTNKAAFARELMAGNYNKVLRLLRAGADVNQNVMNGDAPLHLTCLNGDVDCAQLLIENKADVDKARIEDDATPLFDSVFSRPRRLRATTDRIQSGRRQSEDRRRLDSALHGVSKRPRRLHATADRK